MSEIKLMGTKLSAGARILFEVAIAFSPRLSERGGAAGGRCVFSDVIRVWRVVEDHDNLSTQISQIEESHRRGTTCRTTRRLLKMNEGSVGIVADDGTRVPKTYSPRDDTAEQALEGMDDGSMALAMSPPANHDPTQYNALKFYRFDAAALQSLLSAHGAIELPFNVTEKEYEILTAGRENMVEPRAVLLLGRSGTGKTTCIVARMWREFRQYWGSAFCADTVNEAAAFEPRVQCTRRDGSTSLEHWRAIFVTRNAVLRDQVERNFNGFRQGQLDVPQRKSAGGTRFETFASVGPEDFPLFVSGQEWLKMLDSSLQGESFFGSAGVPVDSWDGEAGGLKSISQYFDDDDSESDEDYDGASADDYSESDDDDIDDFDFADGSDGDEDAARSGPKTLLEVNFSLFSAWWPKINSKARGGARSELSPACVWTEIKSFIKGSAEALDSKGGCLDLDSYKQLGAKRSSMDDTEREVVYGLYLRYERLKRRRHAFDEMDFVFNLVSRVRKYGHDPNDVDAQGRGGGVSLHGIFVDEVQDFTQAEVQLLLEVSDDPNALFLAGDTAQAINRGVGFRFKDIKTLFHRANECAKERAAYARGSEVRQPLWRALELNHRSHSGILTFASCVVELLYCFFSKAVDKLPPDNGLFPGPKPVLLQQSDVDQLILLLQGNQRKTAQIEFGAKQVVLVRNEAAREELPDALRTGLVMTIFEAKGLEFDDGKSRDGLPLRVACLLVLTPTPRPFSFSHLV